MLVLGYIASEYGWTLLIEQFMSGLSKRVKHMKE